VERLSTKRIKRQFRRAAVGDRLGSGERARVFHRLTEDAVHPPAHNLGVSFDHQVKCDNKMPFDTFDGRSLRKGFIRYTAERHMELMPIINLGE
jgi:hypothetical protein